jgi:hypothetical protein
MARTRPLTRREHRHSGSGLAKRRHGLDAHRGSPYRRLFHHRHDSRPCPRLAGWSTRASLWRRRAVRRRMARSAPRCVPGRCRARARRARLRRSRRLRPRRRTDGKLSVPDRQARRPHRTAGLRAADKGRWQAERAEPASRRGARFTWVLALLLPAPPQCFCC